MLIWSKLKREDQGRCLLNLVSRLRGYNPVNFWREKKRGIPCRRRGSAHSRENQSGRWSGRASEFRSATAAPQFSYFLVSQFPYFLVQIRQLFAKQLGKYRGGSEGVFGAVDGVVAHQNADLRLERLHLPVVWSIRSLLRCQVMRDPAS